MPAFDSEPQIFISFPGEERLYAQELAADLAEHGVKSFVDVTSVEVGVNIVEAIDKALTQSDYFVLLWSKNTVDRPWVTAEWTAALTRAVNERRSFVYVVRLDDTELPTMLAPYKYLNAFDDWDGVATGLASAWRIHRSMGVPVLPTPQQPHRRWHPGVIDVFARNRGLSVSHQINAVPATATGPALLNLLMRDLRLPDHVPELDEVVATRIRYGLEFAGRPVTDRPLTEQGIAKDSTVDLLVSVDLLSHGEVISTWTLRTEQEPAAPNGLTTHDVRAIINGAFGHLRPW
jgi:hypothetical protein